MHSDWFVKDLPVERLAAGDVLLAYELDGAPLPAEHFSLPWLPVERGEVIVSARALEARGATQSADGARNAIHMARLEVQ